MDAYVKEVVASKAAGVVTQVNKLMSLPLVKQSQFVILRASLAIRTKHIMCTALWDLVCEIMGAVETAMRLAVAAVFRLLDVADPTGVLLTTQLKLQIKLTLQHGDFGLRTITSKEA